ncbi:MAG: uroporphyrinogen decarboxylase [Pseudomonadota bacterium]
MPSTFANSPFMRALKGEAVWPPPVWLMRQAGRYLLEYRATRAEAGSFLDLCYNPELATEVTLQPIRRYGFDAAILFADILLVPQAVGQTLTFEAGEGPVLSPPLDPEGLKSLSLDGMHDQLSPIYETVKLLRERLPHETPLIGFAGAPWTVATYMIAGRGTKAPADLRVNAYRHPGFVEALIELLTEATTAYLVRQIEAGVQAVQLFDTWAGGLPPELFQRFCVAPVAAISAALKKDYPDIPIIAFPRGAGPAYRDVAALPTIDAVGLDVSVPLQWAKEYLAPHGAIQGNLDPLALLGEEAELVRAVEAVLEGLKGAPAIFNLGHGITPEASPEAVSALLRVIRNA